jgi:hypothetical protein
MANNAAPVIRQIKILILPLLAAFLIGCTIPLTANPPPAGTQIDQLCIIDNPRLFSQNFRPELKRQIESYGIKTQLWTAYNPAGCRYWLDYTANWRFDFVPNLVYAELNLYEGQTKIAYAIFDDASPSFKRYGYGNASVKLTYLTQALVDKNWKDPNLDQ